MVASFFGLAIALQAVVEAVEQLRDFDVTDRMMVLSQYLCDRPCALAGPAQWRFSVPTRVGIDQRFEGRHQVGVREGNRLAARARATDPIGRQQNPGINLPDPFQNRFARQAARSMYEHDAPMAGSFRFAG